MSIWCCVSIWCCLLQKFSASIRFLRSFPKRCFRSRLYNLLLTDLEDSTARDFFNLFFGVTLSATSRRLRLLDFVGLGPSGISNIDVIVEVSDFELRRRFFQNFSSQIISVSPLQMSTISDSGNVSLGMQIHFRKFT